MICLCWYKRKFISQNLWNDSLSNSNVLNFHIANTRHLCWLYYETWPVWWQACTCCVMKPDLFDDRTAPDVLWNLTCLMKGLHLMCYETWPVWWQDYTWSVMKPELFDDRNSLVVLWNLTCLMTGLHSSQVTSLQSSSFPAQTCENNAQRRGDKKNGCLSINQTKNTQNLRVSSFKIHLKSAWSQT